MRMAAFTAWMVVCGWVPWVHAQSSSLLRPPAAVQPSGTGEDAAAYGNAAGHPGFVTVPPRETARPSTRTIERMSMIAVPRIPPRKFKVQDLITIIVRQQKKYEADAKLDTKKQWDISGKLNDWFRFYPRNRLGQDQLSNGKPGFDFNFKNRLKSDGDSEREDKFITRIEARIIDVKPNGNLILEAKQEEIHDDEGFEITLTGECRSEDVTPDNTILSTQIAELRIEERNRGAVRDATTRGWVPRILDWAKPF